MPETIPTDITATSTPSRTITQDGHGNIKISVKATEAAVQRVTPPPPALGTAERDAWLPKAFLTPQALVASQKEGHATITRLSQELAVLKAGAPSTTATTTATPPSPQIPITPATVENLTSVAAAALTGTDVPPTASVVVPPAPSAPIPGVQDTVAQTLDLPAMSAEWAKNGGKLTPASQARLDKLGVTKEVVEQYVQAQMAWAANNTASLEQVVGGKDRLGLVLQWYGANEKETGDLYNAALAKLDYKSARLILAGMNATYADAVGHDPRLSMSGAESARMITESPFLSQGELQTALSDPRYKAGTDAQFIRSVERRALQFAAMQRTGRAGR